MKNRQVKSKNNLNNRYNSKFHYKGGPIMTNKNIFLSIILISFALIFFTGCEFGLGAQIDLISPELDNLSYENGDYIDTNSNFVLSGSSNEKIKEVTLKIELKNQAGTVVYENTLNSSDPNLTISDTNWNYDVADLNVPYDGEYTFYMTIEDSSGNITEKSLLLRVDKTDPVVLLTTPQNLGAGNPYNGNISVKGESGDNFQIDQVYFTLRTNGSVVDDIADLTDIPIDGTYSWYYTLQSYISGTRDLNGNYDLYIYALDKAGNRSDGFYFQPDIYNGLATDSIEDLQNALCQDRSYQVLASSFTAADFAPYKLTSIMIEISQDSDKPQVTFYNPSEEYLTAVPPQSPAKVSGSTTLFGELTDDDGIDTSTMKIFIDGTEYALASVLTGFPGSYVNGSGKYYTWSIPVLDLLGTSLTDGPHTIDFSVEDLYGVVGVWSEGNGNAPMDFSVNSGVPTLQVSNPAPPSNLNQNFTISATAESSAGIASVTATLINPGDANDTHVYNLVNVGGNDWEATVNVETVNPDIDGVWNLRVEAVANDAQSAAPIQYPITIDTENPRIQFRSPSTGSIVTSTVTIQGSSADNNSLVSLQLVNTDVDPADTANYYLCNYTEQQAEDLYYWQYQFDTAAMSLYATDIDPVNHKLFQLNLQAIATDVAGNVETLDYTLIMDLEGDKPVVTILNPSDGAVIGGPVFVTGQVADDNIIAGVYIQVDANGDGDYNDTNLDIDGDGNYTIATTVIDDTFESLTVANNGGVDSTNANYFEDETLWYYIGNGAVFSYSLNQNGKIEEMARALGGNIKFRVRALDENNQRVQLNRWGNAVELNVTLDASVPRIYSLAPENEEFVGQFFEMTGQISDDHGINKIEISYDGGIDYDVIYDRVNGPNTLGAAEDLGPVGATTTFDLHKTVNSLDLDDYENDYVGVMTNGRLPIRIRITDDNTPTPYVSVASIEYLVDAEDPTVSILNSLFILDELQGESYDGANNKARIQGIVDDDGSRGIGAVDKVEVFFTRGGFAFDLTDPADSASAADIGLTDGYPDSANAVIVIDNIYENGNDGGVNGDGDNFNEQLQDQGSQMSWWCDFDSTVMYDGQIEINVVAYDKAGNTVTDQFANGFIKNKKVVYEDVFVGTDIDLNNSVAVAERNTYTGYVGGALTGNQTIFNNMFYIDWTTSEGNGTARTHYVFPGSSSYTLGTSVNMLTNTTSGTATADTVIDLSHANWSGLADGVHNFTLVTVDEVGISSDKIITVIFDNVDDQDPTVISDVLSRDSSHLAEHGDVNNPYPYTGYIELASASLNDGAGTSDPDVSGVITITGTVVDNQRMNLLYMSIEDFDITGSSVAGSQVLIAHWDGALGQFVAETNVPELTISDTLTVDGHIITWEYEWNTSNLENVTGLDTTVTVRAIDHFTNDGTESLTYDVVPYITEIARDPSSYTTIRSHFGYYPIRRTEALFTINGFNLYGGAGTNSVSLGGVNVTPFTTLSSSQIQFTIPNNAATGELVLTANSLVALNNSNSDEDYNLRTDVWDPTNPFWNDDCYVHVWDSDNTENTNDNRGYFAESDNPIHPSMAIDTNGRLYASWSSYLDSTVNWAANNDNGRNIVFNSYDPAEHTDIVVTATDSPTIAFNANLYGNQTWNEGGSGGVELHANGDRKYGEGLWRDQMLMQFINQRVTRNGNDVHVSYFDTDTSAMKYAYFNATSGSNAEQPWVNIDGGSDTGANQDTEIVAAGRSAKAGLYSAIALDEQNLPVIMYYDITNQTLKLARATTTSPQLDTEWTIQTVFQTDDPNRTFVGKYVSMTIDSSGIIHAAFYRSSTGELLYIRSDADVDNGTNTYVFRESEIVDSIGSVGVWADITVSSTGVPSISYLDSSRSNTFSGLKVAYYDATKTADLNNDGDTADAGETGFWEYMNIPLAYDVETMRTSIEADTAANPNFWDVAIGYGSSDYYRVAYYIP